MNKLKQVGFIGSYDKKDLLLYMGKVLTNCGFRVLIVDATIMQRMRYIIQNTSSNNSMTFVSEYLGVDVAVGFMNLGQIAAYFKTNNLQYDVILIDSDNVQTMNSFMLYAMKSLFLVTSFDQSEINRAIETLKFMKQPISITQVIMSADLSSSQEKALVNRLSENGITLSKHKVQFADTNIDRKAILQNQLVREIRLKNHTNTFKDSLEYITSLTVEELIEQSEIKKEIRKM